MSKKKRIRELEKRVADLEYRLASLEARPVVQPLDLTKFQPTYPDWPVTTTWAWENNGTHILASDLVAYSESITLDDRVLEFAENA